MALLSNRANGFLATSRDVGYTIRMQIGVSTAAYYGRLETEEAAARLASLGVPCCEVFLETYSEYTPAFGAQVKENLGATQAVSIHAKTQHFESDIFGQSRRQREDAFAMMERFFQAGQVLGAGVYVYHGPASIRTPSPNLDRWQAGVEQAIALAASYGIDFCWETVSWCHLNHPDRARIFRERWPDLHFVLDVKQVYELGHDPLDYARAMGDRLRHVHMLDRDAGGKLVLPGKGIHDFRDLATYLQDTGYRGDIILEPYADVVPNDDALLESVTWLRETFGAQ